MPPKPSKSGALVHVGPRHVVQKNQAKKHTHRDEHGRYPTTSKALILRDQRSTLSGGSASAQRITGREKLDLLAEDLVEQAKKALSTPFRLERAQKIAVSEYDLSLDAIAQLRDPDLFMGSVQRECIARVEDVPADPRQAAIHVTGFLKNASFVAQTVNTMVHNSYMVASAWQIVYSTLDELQKEYGLSDATIKSQLASSERMRSRYLALYHLTDQLVEAAQMNFSNLARNNKHYASYFKHSDYHKARKNDIMFDVERLKDTGRNFVDSIIMEICFPNSTYPKNVLLQILRDAVQECPREAKRFPQALWDAMGSFSTLVSFKEIIEAPFFGSEGETLKNMSFEQPSDYEQWLDAQFYSLEATKNIDFKVHLQALDKTKQPAVLESIWKSINQNYIAVSGVSIDDLWGLEGALERAPQWNSYFMPTLNAENQAQGRAIGGRKKRLAITQSGGGFESDDSMPGLQSVSNSSDEEESDYADDSDDDDDESDAESEDSGYDTDHEDQLRDLYREAMEMHQEWGFQDREGIQMDSDNSREEKNPFLKLLASLRGRMFQSEPKMQTKAAPAAPKTKKGFFNRTAPTRKAANYAPAPSGFKDATPKAPPKAPGPAAPAPHGVIIEEVEDPDENADSTKKKKKKKPKKKKKKTAGQTEEQSVLERVATPPPSSPPPPVTPTATKAAKSAKSPKPKPPTSPPDPNNASTPSFFQPLEPVATAQSAHSYLKEVEVPKQKVKTRSETGSILEPEKKKGAFKSFVSKMGFGKKTNDEGQVKAKKSWFSSLNKKYISCAEKLMKADKNQGKVSMKWDEFEQFMKKMGFEVDPSTAGSSVRFDPPNKTDRSITFHKPHPDSTIDHIHVQIFGKKLRDYYGWDEEDLKEVNV